MVRIHLFEERMKEGEKRVEAAKADKMPTSFLSAEGGQPVQQQVEEFLKMRPGETREAFSQRFGRWLSDGDPGLGMRMDKLVERGRLGRKLALVAISLAGRTSHWAAWCVS